MDFNDFDVLIELAAGGGRANVDPEIFAEMFHAWNNCLCTKIHYHRVEDGAAMDLFIEPHILKMRDGVWYTKARIFSKSSDTLVRTLALHRITEAYPTTRKFERKLSIDNTGDPNDLSLFALPKHAEVKLALCNSAIQYAQEYLPPGNFILDRNQMILTLHDIEDYKICNFVLLSAGNATVLSPASLRDNVLKQAAMCISSNSRKQVSKSWLNFIKHRIFGKLLQKNNGIALEKSVFWSYFI